MRILAITPMLPWPLDHGGRMRTHALLQGLAPEHEVTVLAGCAHGPVQEATAALRDHGMKLLTAPLTPQLGRLDAAERLRKLWNLLRGRSALLPRFHSSAMAQLVRDAARGEPEVILLDHVWMAPYLRELPQRPLLFSTQNLESALIRQKADGLPWAAAQMARREARLLQEVEAQLAAQARLTLAVTEDDKRGFDALGARSCEVVTNGVDLAARPLMPEADGPPTLLFVGGADYAPNALAARILAVDVLPLVRREIPEARVLLVGADPAGILADLRGLEHVEMAGSIADMLTAWRRTHVLVTPLRHGGGSRLKILEAFAVGRAVVSTTIGASGLPVTHGRELLLADNAADLAAATVQVLRQQELRGKLRVAARKVAEAHDWAHIQKRLRMLVAAAFGRGAGSAA